MQDAESSTAVPQGLGPLFGTFLDCDAHLYMTPDVMESIVGPVGGEAWLESCPQAPRRLT